MGALLRLPIVRPLPATRGDCIDGPRPCPHAKCRYHFATDRREQYTKRRSSSGETCVLDVVDRGGALTLEQISEHYGTTRERVRQIESKAIAKVLRRAKFPAFRGYAEHADHDFESTSSIAQELVEEGDGGLAAGRAAADPEEDEKIPAGGSVWEGLWARGWDPPGHAALASERVFRAYVERAIDLGFDVRRTKHDPKKAATALAAMSDAELDEARAANVVLDVKSEAAPAAKESDMGAVLTEQARAAIQEQILHAVGEGAYNVARIVDATGLNPSGVKGRVEELVRARKLARTGKGPATKYTLPNGKGASVPPPAPVEAKKPKGTRSPRPKAAPKLRPADVTPTNAGYRVHWKGVVIECPDIASLRELVEEVGS